MKQNKQMPELVGKIYRVEGEGEPEGKFKSVLERNTV
jgi:hypothetical protein